MSILKRAEKAIDKIIADLKFRQGFDSCWASTDGEIRAEIREAWTAILVKELEG